MEVVGRDEEGIHVLVPFAGREPVELQDRVPCGELRDEGPFPGWNGEETYANWQYSQPDDDYCYAHCEDFLAIGWNDAFGWNDQWAYDSSIKAYVVEYDLLDVAIDIKPGTADNPINLKTEGVVPVAVLSSPTFDATTLDPSTATFGPTGTEASALSCALDKDVNADGLLDAVCRFEVLAARIGCGETSATLLARTACGYPIGGSDALHTLGCPPYALAIEALQDVSHETVVQLAVNVIAKGFSPPPLAEHVHLKSHDILGDVAWTDNVDKLPLAIQGAKSVGTLVYTDLERHQRLEAHAQVRNSKSRTLENLLAETPVLLRPDLAIGEVQAPTEAYTGQIVNIIAGVRELNGDLGAVGTAYLLENGAVIDQANGIAIDPLGQAGVVFTTIFSVVGTHTLTIRMDDVSPGDYDLSNNERTIAIEVSIPPLQSVPFSAYYSRDVYDYLYAYENPYEIYSYDEQGASDYLQVYYSLVPLKYVFPIDSIALDIVVDGELRESLVAHDIDGYGYDSGCYYYQSGYGELGPGIWFYTYNYRDSCYGYTYEYSYAYFYRSAYRYQYHSVSHDKVWGQDNWNYTGSYGNDVTLLDANDSIETTFVIQDDGGAFGGKATIPSLSSGEYFDEWDYFYYDTHYWGHYYDTHVYGSNWGMTDVAPGGGAGGARVVGGRFLRGDGNSDGWVDMSDPIYTLSYLFLGGEAPRCVRAADANGDGTLDIADCIRELSFLFGGGSAPPPPYPGCGYDRLASSLTCEAESECR